MLQVDGLTKRFGGLTAVDQVSLNVTRGELHAVIGPNGAGKSTLINLLSGDLLPSSGTILFNQQEVSQLTTEKRSRLGFGRSYQKTNIFPSFSTLENCRLAAQSRAPHGLNWLRDALDYKSILQAAQRALAVTHLSHRSAELALALSHGEQRHWNRHVPWPPSRNCCCSTNRWPAWAPRIPAHDRADRHLPKLHAVLLRRA